MAGSTASMLRVMIIDSQRSMRGIVKQILEQAEIENVVEANSAEEAFKMVRDAGFVPPDLIISELHLDKVDGMEMVSRIRRGKEALSVETPVVILTTDDDIFLHDVTKQVGASVVLTIPISGPDLLEGIEKAVGFSLGA